MRPAGADAQAQCPEGAMQAESLAGNEGGGCLGRLGRRVAGQWRGRSPVLRVGAVTLGLATLLAWSHWPTLAPLALEWWRDQNYSIGMLVPLAALYLAWEDRDRLSACRIEPSGWGIVVILLGQAARLYGLVSMRESVDRYGMVLTIAGLVLLVGGRQVFRRSLWILLFLFLMVPLPASVHNLIAGPLQKLAATGAALTLELMGAMVSRDGTVITLGNMRQINVAEACSGLRMLTAFIVVAWAMAYLVRRPAWEKVVLVASSIPVAILCNLVRLVVTALLFMAARTELADWFFHEAGGWAMMVLAVGLLRGELWLLDRVFCEDKHEPIRAVL